MAITARHHAMRNGARPTWKRIYELAFTETLLVMSWVLLLGAIARLMTESFMYLLPLQYIFASILVAWLECPGSLKRTSPLAAFGFIEARNGGSSASQWQTLIRVLLTPLSLITAAIGFLPVLFDRTSFPELVSRSRIVILDPGLDPRSSESIQNEQSRIKRTVWAYTGFSMVIAVLIFFVPVRTGIITQQNATIYSVMTEEDEELLAIYLDLSTKNPDRLEFHVRLASLYYRNRMIDDLSFELGVIRRLDPDHAILMLEEDAPIDIADLIVESNSQAELIPKTGFIPLVHDSAPDSSDDSLSTASDTTTVDSLRAADSTTVILPDTVPTAIIDSLLTLPETEEPETPLIQPDTASAAVTDSIQTPDREPDVLPDTSAVEHEAPTDSLPPPAGTDEGEIATDTTEATSVPETVVEPETVTEPELIPEETGSQEQAAPEEDEPTE